MFLAGNATPRSNLALLDKMIATRTEMAETVGCGSYSEYKALDASLAQGPEAIVGFLQEVAAFILPEADREVHALARLKGGRVEAWDAEHLMARARAEACTMSQAELSEWVNARCNTAPLCPPSVPNAHGLFCNTCLLLRYLNLGSVLQGFGELMQRLFGLSIQVGEGEGGGAEREGALPCPAHPSTSLARFSSGVTLS